MAVLKERCPNCGGTILLLDKSKVGECDSCGMTYSLSELQQIKEKQVALERNALKSERLIKDVHSQSTVDANVFSIEDLCRKAETALETEQWKLVYSLSDEIIRREPKFAKAYLYKLLADCRIFKKEELENCEVPFDENDNYHLLVRFADEYLKAEIKSYSETVRLRYQVKALESRYQSLCVQASVATAEAEFQKLANDFYKLGNYKDSKKHFEECLKKFKKINGQKKPKCVEKSFLERS